MAETHWTEDSIDGFVHRLSFDFITQLAKRLENGPLTRADLAQKLKVSKGRISQILNSPSNLTLKKAVSYARALGIKVSVVAYDDNDPDNHNGPVSSEIFDLCWQRAGKPVDFQTAEGRNTDTAETTDNVVALPERRGFVLVKRSAKSNSRYTVILDTNILIALAQENAATNERQQEPAIAAGG